ncbi:MAG: hypothetical protein WCL22_01000 [bacterium]
MGDRMVIGFQAKSAEPTIYLYAQWGGESQKEILVNALQKSESRWTDSDYATRICISQIVGNSWNDTLGFGISVNNFCSPDYDTIQVVEWHKGKVSIRETSNPENVLEEITLETFCQDDTLVKEQFDKIVKGM